MQLDPIARKTGLHALEVIDRGVELAFLAAVAREGRVRVLRLPHRVRPSEEKRAAKKNKGLLADLLALRDLP